LRQQRVIQKFIAFVLVVIFAISVTPKLYFHDAVAHHKDAISCDQFEPGFDCVHTQPFHCHFDDLVVTAPFVIENDPFFFLSFIDYADKQNAYRTSYSQPPFSHKTSRGPPVA
jgi:hypothetical protein